MNSESFYITITSNTSTHFPANKQHDFRNLLPQTIDLSSQEYEVALTSAIIPNQYSLFPPKSLYLIFVEKRYHPDRSRFKKKQHQVYLNVESIQSIDDQINGGDIIRNINETIQKYVVSNKVDGKLIFKQIIEIIG